MRKNNNYVKFYDDGGFIAFPVKPDVNEVEQTYRYLIQAIETSKTFDMSIFTHECGTPACIAGHLAHFNDISSVECRKNWSKQEWLDMTMDGLNISEKNAENLICGHFYKRPRLEPEFGRRGERIFKNGLPSFRVRLEDITAQEAITALLCLAVGADLFNHREFEIVN